MLHVDTESNSMKWIQSHQECISCNWNMYIPQLVDDLLQHTGGGDHPEWNPETGILFHTTFHMLRFEWFFLLYLKDSKL